MNGYVFGYYAGWGVGYYGAYYYSPYGLLGDTSYISGAGLVNLSEPTLPALPVGFWDLGHTAHANGLSTSSDGIPILVTPDGQSFAAPAAASRNPAAGDVQYDKREVTELVATVSEDLAAFWERRGRIAGASFPSRPHLENPEPIGGASDLGTVLQAFQAESASGPEAADGVWIAVPDGWSSARVAKLIVDAAYGKAGTAAADLRDGFDDAIEAREREGMVGESGSQVPPSSDGFGDVPVEDTGDATEEIDPNYLPFDRLKDLLSDGRTIELVVRLYCIAGR